MRDRAISLWYVLAAMTDGKAQLTITLTDRGLNKVCVRRRAKMAFKDIASVSVARNFQVLTLSAIKYRME